MEWWEAFKEWFLSLGEKYNVNPYIFGGIYVGAIPIFFICLCCLLIFVLFPLICILSLQVIIFQFGLMFSSVLWLSTEFIQLRPRSKNRRKRVGFKKVSVC